METEKREMTLPAVLEPQALDVMRPDDLLRRMRLIQEVASRAMVEKVDYGTIPGCGDKPTLFKAGAEKLCVVFRLVPRIETTTTELGGGHREVSSVCYMHYSSHDGPVVGQGVGTCSTMETKYRYRQGQRKCPACGRETIIKGKEEFGGGWLCFAKMGGCGAKFGSVDKSIVDQQVGRVENSDPADCYNTALKMSKKRALVDACLTTTGASAIFTQDIEDFVPEPPAAKAEPLKAEAPPPAEEKPPPKPQSKDVEHREEICRLLLEIHGGDVDKASGELEAITTFVGKDGKTIPGKRKTSELSERQVPVVLRKARDLHDEWQAEQTQTAQDAEGKNQ